jgi:hypothetical protein
MGFSVPLTNETFGKKEDLSKIQYKRRNTNDVYYFDDDNYARFNQPWTLNLNANYGYSRNATKFGTKVASIGIDSTLSLHRIGVYLVIPIMILFLRNWHIQD